jgi:hypothetical protein
MPTGCGNTLRPVRLSVCQPTASHCICAATLAHTRERQKTTNEPKSRSWKQVGHGYRFVTSWKFRKIANCEAMRATAGFRMNDRGRSNRGRTWRISPQIRPIRFAIVSIYGHSGTGRAEWPAQATGQTAGGFPLGKAAPGGGVPGGGVPGRGGVSLNFAVIAGSSCAKQASGRRFQYWSFPSQGTLR